MSKELNKAPVEQADGDERAAFEAWLAQAMSKKFEPDFDLAKYEDSGEYRYSPAAAYWKAWQARAALAQPSPAQVKQAEAERPELWAVHAQGPDELYAAFNRADAEKHAVELNCLPVPVSVSAVVIPSPWPPAEHWQYLAEQERDHKNEIAVRLRQFERICEGLPQDAIDGGWTVQGIRAHSKQLEEQLKVAQAEVEALRAELQSQRERNTELIFKLGSATNGWGRCEKERDAALAKLAELETQVPVAAVSEETFSANGTSDIITRNLPIGTTLYAAPVVPAQAALPTFAEKVLAKLRRFSDCASDFESGGVDIGRHWLDLLTQLGLLNRTQRSPALWEISQQGDDLLVARAAQAGQVPQAWLDVQTERRRQVEAEGWTPEHDDLYCAAELPRAAAAYILSGANDEAPAIWPFLAKWWKPRDARANYVRAGALILAEIERLDRAAAPGKEGV
ncbi:hypothetical protein O2604_17200 [Pseudomonas aeruginosa]|uniref:hypothetical protein n=1 Tax=Pseudomonas aeruginosa TaxID=287 RepID=UPI0022B03D96|nr:hypothetical protein [Pseudomonas aeruginosa]WAW38799.1 hypothetical protein O2604_17200 [Pseudomonas aeruginosa]